MEWIYLVLIGLVLAASASPCSSSAGARAAAVRRRPRPAPADRPADRAPPTAREPRDGRRRWSRRCSSPSVGRAEAVAPPATLREPHGPGPRGPGRRLRRRPRRRGITDETWDDLEEALLRADVGIGVTTQLLDELRARVKAKEITEPDAAARRPAGRDEGAAGRRRPRAALRARRATAAPTCGCSSASTGSARPRRSARSPTSSATRGARVLMAAGDTFRAAAAEQLATWAERADAELVRGSEGGDPSAVVFDAVERAASRGYRPRAGRHGRAPAHQDEPDGGAAQGAPRRREGRRAGSPRCCS